MLPPIREMRAVQRIVYDPARVKKLGDLACEIGTLMNLVTAPCGGLTIGNPGPNYGKGPTWYVIQGATLYSSGVTTLNPSVAEAAERCDRLAALILDMHDALAHANVRASAKADLRTGLAELAASWQRRGAMWRDPDPTHGDTHVQAISTHFRASMKAFERVRYYL